MLWTLETFWTFFSGEKTTNSSRTLPVFEWDYLDLSDPVHVYNIYYEEQPLASGANGMQTVGNG